MARNVVIKNIKESTITLSNFSLILRGKSTGHGEAKLLIENINQEGELNGLKKLGYITIEELDNVGKAEKTESKSRKADKKTDTVKQYEEVDLDKDSGRVIIMTSDGPNEVKTPLNKLMDIPDDPKTQKSLDAAKEYDNSDDYIEDFVQPQDVATIALGNNKFEQVKLKHSILPEAKSESTYRPDTKDSKKQAGKLAKDVKDVKNVKTNKAAKQNKSAKVSVKPKAIRAVGNVRVSENQNSPDLLFTTQSPPDSFIDT